MIATTAKLVQKRMQAALSRSGVPLMLCWTPDPTKSVHGEIKENVLFIYDQSENDAWDTLTHELLEYKLKQVTRVYRTMINSLIDGYEKLCYERKEEVLESLPKVLQVIRELRDEGSATSTYRKEKG